jgi:hypothetical protein
MQLVDAPGKVVLPFAVDGSKNAIPVQSQIPVTPGAASYTDGFPPLTMVDPTEGGVGPSGLDFNGIFFALSALSRWFNAGSGFVYDAAFAAAIGGYPVGARVLLAGGSGYWRNTVDNNSSNPDAGGAGWVPDGSNNLSTVFASTQQTIAVGSSKIMFDTVEFDNGFWDAINQRFVARYPGKYRVSGAVTLIAPGGQSLATQIFRNGGVVRQCFQAPQVSDGNLSLPFGCIQNMAAGDFLEAFLVVSQTPVLAGVVGSNQPFVFAQLEYLGT